MFCWLECYVFIQKELEEYDHNNGQDFGDYLIHLHHANATIKNKIAQQHTAKPHKKEYSETFLRLILHLKVVCSVKDKTRGDSCQHTYSVRHQVMPTKHIDKQRV